MENRPKRRKSKDNPYTLDKIEEKRIYKVLFSDSKGNKYEIEINSEVYEALNQFELDDLKQMNEFDRHIEHIEQSEEQLHKNALKKQETIENKVIDKLVYENLLNKISMLPPAQSRRIKMYFFEDKTMECIAKIEKCSKVAVKHSIDDGLKNLKKFLNF